MVFVGIVTDKNSENNIKNNINNKFMKKCQIIFLNTDNVSNFRNVKFDSIIINEKIDNQEYFSKIIDNSKYILVNTDIDYKSKYIKEIQSNVITYGYNSNALVTISSATEDNYMFFIQDNIYKSNTVEEIQEIKFEKTKNNMNAYDGMIISLMEILYRE